MLDAGHNILGIPWWMWLAAGALLVGIAVLAAPELLAFLPELGEAAGLELDTEAAIEAEELAAQSRLEAMAAKVNPLGGTDNCAWVAREVDEALGDMLAGRDPNPYAPDWFEPDMPDGSETASQGLEEAPWQGDASYNQALEQEYGSQLQPSSMQQIADQLEAAGNGARGIVRVAPAEGGVGHVFNAVNYGGDVFFIDGQSGEVFTSTEFLPSGWQGLNPNVWFMTTGG